MKKYIPFLVITSLLLSACSDRGVQGDVCQIAWKKWWAEKCLKNPECEPIAKKPNTLCSNPVIDCEPPPIIGCKKTTQEKFEKNKNVKDFCEKTGRSYIYSYVSGAGPVCQ